MNTKGFTLMEILAVLLVLAVVISFAMPGIRAVRDEITYHQAKTAAVKMADAVRLYYKDTKGVTFDPEGPTIAGKTESASDDSVSAREAAQAACNTQLLSGIPGANNNVTTTLTQLFACGYLSVKDFEGLPYEFSSRKDWLEDPDIVLLVRAVGTEAARRHAGDTWCVYRDHSVTEECPKLD